MADTLTSLSDAACAAAAARVETALCMAAHLVSQAMAEIAAVACEDYLPGDLSTELGGLTGMLMAARDHIAATDVTI